MIASAREFLSAVETDPAPDRVAEALVQHLGSMSLAGLPPASHTAWREMAALLKVDATKPLPPRAIAAIASWPKDRIAKLLEAARRLVGVLEQIENDRLEDEVRDKMRRHYL